MRAAHSRYWSAMPGFTFEKTTSVTSPPGATPGPSVLIVSPKSPPASRGTTSPRIAPRSGDFCQAARADPDSKFTRIVHGTSGLSTGGGIISVLMNPGNFEMTAECLACQVENASSAPG